MELKSSQDAVIFQLSAVERELFLSGSTSHGSNHSN